MKRFLLLSLAVAACAPDQPTNQPTNQPTDQTAPQPHALAPNATVIEVIDGDTIFADISGNRTLVRFLGIDTPEKTGGYLPAECFGDAASARTKQLTPPGTAVHLERDIELLDRYDRVLAHVFRAADGLNVNLSLLASGHAAVLVIEPNVANSEIYEAAEAKARTAGLGLWSACGGPDLKLT